MHKIKHRKLLISYLSGIIIVTSLGTQLAYANGEQTNSNESEIVIEEIKTILINEITNLENIGLYVNIKGTITNIDKSNITLKDESGEGLVYLDSVTKEDLKIGDIITVKGIVTVKDNTNIIVVDDPQNITVESSVDDSKDDDYTDTDDGDSSEDIETPDKDSANQTKPDNSNSNNSSNSKPSGNTGDLSNKPTSGQTVSSSQKPSSSETEEITANTVKGKSHIIVSSELSSSQWDYVKEALEDGKIKVKDLDNNKIRITKVANETGDTIWIVNDPRTLDVATEEVDIINSKSIVLLNSIDYSVYDVTESKWNTIVDDVIDGNAKIKVLDDETIKVIYKKTDSTDSIITLNKL